MVDIVLHRLGIIMEPEPGNLMETEGVLNPAAIRGPDGALYLFPRLVSKGNYSRIGIARVCFNDTGDPVAVERLGIALEPETDYEKHPDGGGCEDPRITFVESLGLYFMTYVAFSAHGPRIALATSANLFKWERLGLATFTPYKGIEFNGVDNKDSCLFPQLIPCPSGHPELAIIHRPIFPGTSPEETIEKNNSTYMDEHKESIWISYCSLTPHGDEPPVIGRFTSHHHLAVPVNGWEELKIGCGTPPVLTPQGWLIIYHGVCGQEATTTTPRKLTYSAGLMILSKDEPSNVIYRSPKPILAPELTLERVGAIANVVFPTGIDQRSDLGTPNRFDVYFGMADNRIGVARLDLPDDLNNS